MNGKLKIFLKMRQVLPKIFVIKERCVKKKLSEITQDFSTETSSGIRKSEKNSFAISENHLWHPCESFRNVGCF